MLRTVDPTSLEGDYRSHVPRAALDAAGATEAVRGMYDAVRDRGTETFAEYSQRFDGVVPGTFWVPERALAGAAGQLDSEPREAFEESIRRRCLVVETPERDSDPAPTVLAEGARVGLRNIPVEWVSLYIPGGLAPLASSMIMNVVPAQVAGVWEIAAVSSPQADFGGWPHPNILVLCRMFGVEEVYVAGGVQAIAIFTHGAIGLCAPVAMATGSGNVYVVAAKRLLREIAGIDSEVGPTEIAIITDSSVNPTYVATGLISQAEYDPMTASVLITDPPELADLVAAKLESRVAATKHRERIRTALTGQWSVALLVCNLDQAVEVADTYAAEHLEIQTRDVGKVAFRIRNAGVIFIDGHSPVNPGNYSTGSIHVLPTTGCARHGSGLNVRSFMRTVHIIDHSVQALSEIVDGIGRFALTEDLPGHAAAITVRTRR